MFKVFLKFVVVAAVTVACSSPGNLLVATASEPEMSCQSLRGSQSFSICKRSGKEIVKHKRGLAVQKPLNGTTLEQTLHRVDGTWEKISVSADFNGTITQQYTSSSSEDGRPFEGLKLLAGLSSTNCGSPDYFSLGPGKSVQPATWWYREFSQPDTKSLYRVKEGFLTWSKGINRCNSTVVKNSYTSNYAGKTTLDLPYQGNPWLPDFGACLSAGPKDIVGWDMMDRTTLGVTCTEINLWNFLGVTSTHSSIILNQFLGWYTDLETDGCVGELYDLKSVVTHEVGHSLGLDHYTHQGQTMYRYLEHCDVNKRGLGYGDVHGVAQKYPVN